MNGRQFIYHMQGLTKTYPPSKKVLDNLHLSFYPDAKIGVLGVNGSGKSTLLRIMAGLDKEFTGEGFVAEGARGGYLPQEPTLDARLDVRGTVMLGHAGKSGIRDRYNELAMNYSDETADEMTRLQDEIEAQGLWDLDAQVDQAMDALGCSPDDWRVGVLWGGWWGVACRPLRGGGAPPPRAPGPPFFSKTPQICCCSTNRPIISMPRR